MKKILSATLFATFFFAGSAKAEWDHWAVKALGPFDARGIGLYKVDSSDGSATLVGTRCDLDPGINTCYQQIGSGTYVDSETGKFYLENEAGDFISYDPDTEKWTNQGSAWTSSYTKNYARPSVEGAGDGGIKIQLGGTKIYERKANGEIHVGENSWITVEEDGVQKVYAKDANGKAIPINYTEGTDLQINGVSVQGQIDSNKAGVKTNADDIRNNKRSIESLEDNVNDLGFGVAGATALSTAMSALPTVAQDSPLSCGVGTGGYSSRFAMSVGCAVKANDRLSINAGGSYVFGGAADYGNGSLSTAAARAGFVFKFGNLDTPAASNEQLQSQLDEVQEENASIKSKYESMEQRYISIEQQNKELMERLQRLEAIALGNQPAETAVSLK